MNLFDDVLGGPGALNDENAFSMLRELERNTPDEIRSQRSHFRLEIKARVTLMPGNASDLLKFKMQGTTGDVSCGGCRILFPLPVGVGDVYRLEFDRRQLDIPLTFARCVRCSLLRESAYEAGFQFFAPISLPQPAEAGAATVRH
ncbi:MAG: PilZ domain-containing protein [Phycisphaerales bacterium]|nr:PilZ domain-containing protein [Phycisphaerales bacterium]